MQSTRRDMIVTMTGALAVAFAVKPLIAEPAEGQARTPSPQPMPSPNAPTNQNAPVGLDGSEIPVVSGDRVFAPANWDEVKKYAQKILDLATDFKWQVDHTNLKATLPVLLLHEAHDLEKMAKQVQKHMA